MDASEVYLDLYGPGGAKVGGDVEASHYEGQIALYDWDWGVALEEASPHGSIQQAQVQAKQFSFRKTVDLASMTLLSYLHSGEVCEKAIITLVQRFDKNIMLRLKLKNVRLMSYKLKIGSGGKEVALDEDWSISFQEIEIMYVGAEQSTDVRGKVSNSTLRSTSSFKLSVPPGAPFVAKPRREDRTSRQGKDQDIDPDVLAKAVDAQLSKQGKRSN